jgi:hypothetical protein
VGLVGESGRAGGVAVVRVAGIECHDHPPGADPRPPIASTVPSRRPRAHSPSLPGVHQRPRPARAWRGTVGRIHFDTKIGIAVRDDLAAWQKLNVTAFLASGLGTVRSEVVGQPYQDGSGHRYLPMFRQPVLVYAGSADQLSAAHQRALARGVVTGVYTEELFKTGNDDDNRAAVAAVPGGELNLVGLAVYGRRNEIDKILKGLAMHR